MRNIRSRKNYQYRNLKGRKIARKFSTSTGNEFSCNPLVFSRKIVITSTGFYRCCAADASAPVVVINQSPRNTIKILPGPNSGTLRKFPQKPEKCPKRALLSGVFFWSLRGILGGIFSRVQNFRPGSIFRGILKGWSRADPCSGFGPRSSQILILALLWISGVDFSLPFLPRKKAPKIHRNPRKIHPGICSEIVLSAAPQQSEISFFFCF